MLAKIFPNPVNKNEFIPDVTIVFSVFNEKLNIAKKIENCMSLDYPKDKIHLLIASDGSTDNTCSIIRAMQKSYKNIEYLEFLEQRGKSSCINDAICAVTTEYIVLTDVRQEFKKSALKKLLSNFADARVGAVGGELQFKEDESNEYSKGIDIYWKYEKFIRKNESLISSSIGVSGAIYAIKKKYYQPIPENCILDDVFIPMNIVLNKRRVVFEPNAVALDVPSNDADREKKRKSRTIAGNYQLIQLAPQLLNPFKNPVFVQFISHKLLRLIMPLCLTLLFFININIYSLNIFYKLMLFGQLMFYSLPLAGMFLRLPQPLLSIANGIKAFLNLNYFAVLGFKEFIRNKNIHIWK